jgi:hypothetical protein
VRGPEAFERPAVHGGMVSKDVYIPVVSEDLEERRVSPEPAISHFLDGVRGRAQQKRYRGGILVAAFHRDVQLHVSF